MVLLLSGFSGQDSGLNSVVNGVWITSPTLVGQQNGTQCLYDSLSGELQAGLLDGLHRFLCSGKAPSSGGLKAIFSNEWGYELVSLTKLI